MSNIAFQLNQDLSEQVKQVVNDWIREWYDYIHDELVEKEITDEDEVREFLLFEYFNTAGRDFGRYAKKQIEFEWSIPIIQYCNKWLEDNYGEDHLLEWKRFEDMSYLCSHLGYVWFMENGDEIIELFNSLGEETPFK